MDELLDIVDQNDDVVEQKLRSRVYRDGLPPDRFIRVVNILLFDYEGRLLLPRRSSNRRLFPCCYDFSFGEHVAAGESYDKAAERGIKEELGLVDQHMELLGKLGHADGVSSFMQIYKIVSSQKSFNYDKEGIESLQWFEIAKIVEMTAKEPTQFKGDLLPVLKWYLSEYS